MTVGEYERNDVVAELHPTALSRPYAHTDNRLAYLKPTVL